MALDKTTIKISIEKPFNLLYVPDTHICMEYFKQGCEFAREQGAILVHAGDLFNFISEKHLEIAPQLLSIADDYFMAAGNHEYSLYIGEAFEDEAYKMQSFDKVQSFIINHPA